MGVQIIGMSTSLTRNIRSFVDAKFFFLGARTLLLGSVELFRKIQINLLTLYGIRK